MSNFFQNIVEDNVREFKLNVLQKIKENNTFPANIGDPPRKRVLSYPAHRVVFLKAFGVNFAKEEHDSVTNSFRVGTIFKLELVFCSSSLVRVNHHNDIAIISPQLAVTQPLLNLERGDLCLPISKNVVADNCFIKVFVFKAFHYLK